MFMCMPLNYLTSEKNGAIEMLYYYYYKFNETIYNKSGGFRRMTQI